MILKRKTSAVAASEVIAELDLRLEALSARARALLAEQLELESRHVKPAEPGSMPEAQHFAEAAAMLDGAANDAAAVAAAEPDPIRLYQIIAQRKTIEAAIELGRQRGFRLRLSNAAEVGFDITESWNLNIAATARCAIESRKLAEERSRLRSEWSARTGTDSRGLVCGGQADRALGIGVAGDAIYLFIEAARHAFIKD
jgi:hypothetical protein